MNRYKIPRITFINKCDRSGADPYRVVNQLRQKLNHNAVFIQLPIGLEENFTGVIDLVSMKAIYFEGSFGEDIRTGEIPSDLQDEANARREVLLDAASMFSDELMEAVFQDRVSEELIHKAIRKGTLSRELTPVFLGAAYKNIGVQPLLDAVIRYLPSPLEGENFALDLDQGEKEVLLSSNPHDPLVALAYKLDVTPYG
jgi:elongation factor G